MLKRAFAAWGLAQAHNGRLAFWLVVLALTGAVLPASTLVDSETSTITCQTVEISDADPESLELLRAAGWDDSYGALIEPGCTP
jgi:hypothetical protein